jgi:hypothetical protein
VVPKGFSWSNNSCAYDSVLTILFTLWTSGNRQHDDLFQGINSPLARILCQSFKNIITSDHEYEMQRDLFRYALENIDPINHKFGDFTAVGSLLNHLLATEHETKRVHNRCLNNHTETVHSLSSGLFQPATEVHSSIQQWINLPSLLTRRRCRVCNDLYSCITNYIALPQVIAFEITDKETVLNRVISVKLLSNTILNYRLAGIIYFGDMHFVARIIRQDGQIWFHDGITTQRSLIYEGIIDSGQLDLSTAHSKPAHTGIYCRM